MSAVSALIDVIAFAGCLWVFNITLNYIVAAAKRAMKIKMPAMKNDDFMKQNGYSWGYVFVYKVLEEDAATKLTVEQTKFSMRNVIDRLGNAGFETSCFYSCQRDEVYVKVRAKPEILLSTAADMDYKLLMDDNRLRVRCMMGKAGTWAPINLTDEYRQTIYKPYDYIYGKYDGRADLQSLYKTYGIGKAAMLKGVDRIKLMQAVFEKSIAEKGAGLNLNRMLYEKCLEGAFPLHDYPELQSLADEWLNLLAWPSNQPFTKIVDYFGEKLGLYYLFLGHYTACLGWPAIIGIGAYVYAQFYGEDHESLSFPAFGVFMLVWSTVMIELWKRKQALHAMEWGVSGFEDEEQDRPTYEGIKIKSHIDGSDVTYFPAKDANRRKNIVRVVVLLSILGVIAVVVGIFSFQIYTVSNKEMFTVMGIPLGGPLYSIVNAIVIIVLNMSYTGVAIRMNNYENHRTETLYEDNLISKIFVFQIVNSYASLTYVSFIKNTIGFECLNNSCTHEVSSTLSTLFISKLLTANITGIILPKMKVAKTAKQESEGLEPGVFPTPIEKQFNLQDFNLVTNLLTDYANLVIQFGYLTLFVTTFTLAPLMAYVSNYISIRIDAWKLCQIFRRPQPMAAEDIGTWGDMLEVMSALSVIYTFALIMFTGNYFRNSTWTVRWALFLLFEHVTFLVKYNVAALIPDIPTEVEDQLARQEFLMSKVIKNTEDDKDEDGDYGVGSTYPSVAETDGDWEKEIVEVVLDDDEEENKEG